MRSLAQYIRLGNNVWCLINDIHGYHEEVITVEEFKDRWHQAP